MSFRSPNRILELEKIAQSAREQLDILAVRTDNVNANIKHLVESNQNDEEIEKLKDQLSSLKLTSHDVRRSLTDAEVRKKCLLRNQEMKRQDMIKLRPRVDIKNAVSQRQLPPNVKSLEVPILIDENENPGMSVGKPNNTDVSIKIYPSQDCSPITAVANEICDNKSAVEFSYVSKGDNVQKTLIVKVDDCDDNANSSIMNNVEDVNENLGTAIKCSDKKKDCPSPQECFLLSHKSGCVELGASPESDKSGCVELGASPESQCRHENGDVSRRKGDSRGASCSDGKNRRPVKWVQRMIDINKSENGEDVINENQGNLRTQLASHEVYNDAGTITLRVANKPIGDIGGEGKKNLGRTAPSANDRLCRKASANDRLCKKVDNLDFELKPDTKDKATDSRSLAEMRMKMREPVMYKPKLDRSIFRKSKWDQSLFEEGNKTTEPKDKVTDSSSVAEMRKKMREPVMYKPKLDRSLFQKSKLDQSLFEEGNKTTEPLEEKCICLRPLKMILCECRNCFVGRLRKMCPVHPSDLYLLDVDRCKICKSFFPREYDMTEEQSQETYRNPLISCGKF